MCSRSRAVNQARTFCCWNKNRPFGKRRRTFCCWKKKPTTIGKRRRTFCCCNKNRHRSGNAEEPFVAGIETDTDRVRREARTPRQETVYTSVCACRASMLRPL